jgi:hypothetical protein
MPTSGSPQAETDRPKQEFRHYALMAVVSLTGAPLAWTVQTLVSYAAAAHNCYPKQVPLHGPIWGGGLHLLELAVNWMCFAAACVCTYVAWRQLRAMRRPAEADQRTAQRQRFFAASGLMVSCIFLAATLITGSTAIYMRPCSAW